MEKEEATPSANTDTAKVEKKTEGVLLNTSTGDVFA